MIHSRLDLGLPAYLHRRLRGACANWLARANARGGAAQVACFPRDYIGRLVVANGAYEDLILRCLFERTFAARLPDFRTGTALDVGANIGNHSAWFARHFRHVVAFEPNPICVRLFEAGMLMNRLDNVRLVPQGLSDRARPAQLHVNRHGNLGGSSLAAPPAGDAAQDAFAIELVRGDDALANAADASPVRLVKLDVEGHEHAALRGLERTLRRDGPVVMFETAGAGGDGGSAAILDTLGRFGYRHTYVVEAGGPAGASVAARLVRRLAGGYGVDVVAVTRPQDRYYSLVIASVDAL